MRSIECLWDVYNNLSLKINAFDLYGSELLTVVCMKKIFAVAAALYHDYIKQAENNVFCIDDNGLIWQGEYEIEEGEMLCQYAATHSNFTEYLLCYYSKSPFWNIKYVSFDFDMLEDESQLSEKSFLKKNSGTYFESKLFESYCKNPEGNPLKTFYGMFSDPDDDCGDDGVILASSLLPYYYKVEKQAKEVSPDLCGKIRSIVDRLGNWLQGYSFIIKDDALEWTYFIASDQSSEVFKFGSGAGVLDADIEVMVGGEIIDRAIFALDEKLHFLPDKVKEMQNFPTWEVNV